MKKIRGWPELESPDQAEGFVADMKSKRAEYDKFLILLHLQLTE
jgi:hypothetical protein